MHFPLLTPSCNAIQNEAEGPLCFAQGKPRGSLSWAYRSASLQLKSAPLAQIHAPIQYGLAQSTIYFLLLVWRCQSGETQCRLKHQAVLYLYWFFQPSGLRNLLRVLNSNTQFYISKRKYSLNV